MTEHKQIILSLEASIPNFKWRGFRKALNTALPDGEVGYTKFIPDGYVINKDTKTIQLWEVVCSSDITGQKLIALLQFWWEMDAYGWSIEITILNGKLIQTLSDIDLCDLFYEWGTDYTHLPAPANLKHKGTYALA